MIWHVRAIILAMKREPTTPEVPTNPTVRRAWIGFQLRIRGLSGRSVAQREGVSQQAWSAAMLGGGGSSHLQEVAAQLLDLTPQQLWPELYDATGRRLLHTRPPNRTTRHAGGNGKNEEAA